jgi:hypothetical protein
MRFAPFLLAVAAMAQDAPTIPENLQTSFRAAVIAEDLARAEMDLAQAKVNLLKAQREHAIQTALVYEVCGANFEPTVKGSEPIECSPKKKKENAQ